MIGNSEYYREFKVHGLIGRGGTANVYRVENQRVGKLWALKEIVKQRDEHGQLSSNKLIADIDILRNLKHPNIVSIIAAYDEPDSTCILMDHIQGVTLKQRISLEPPSEEQVVEWAKVICDIFKYLHSQSPKIIYRDLKPANLMITPAPENKLVLIDFGAAKRYAKSGDTIDSRLYATVYTPGYCAPEVMRGESSVKSDIYTIGTTMYHLLTGRDPSRGGKLFPIRQINPEYSEGLEKIIIHATEEDPKDRYQTVEEMLDDLENYRSLSKKSIKRRKSQVYGMFACMVGAIACFIASGILSHYAKMLTTDTYNTYIKNAQTATTKDAQIAAYEEAIDLKPEVATAYDELLNKVFLSDGIFSKEEADEMNRILREFSAGSTRYTNEDALKGTAEYDLFCYKLGLAYFYYYEGVGNTTMCVPWLNVAAESQILTEAQISRAKRLAKIAGYSQDLNIQNLAGDAVASYGDYWNDMTLLVEGNIVEEDNVKTAIVVYNDMTYQIRAHAAQFKKAGVLENSLTSMLVYIQDRIAQDFSSEMKTDNQGDIEVIYSNIEAAYTAIEAAYNGRE